MADIFRFFNPLTNSHYFAVGATERAVIAAANPGWLNEGRAFGADTVPSPGSVDVVRFYNPATDRYLFSSNTVEHAIIQQQGWVKQITVFQVFPTDGSGVAAGATTAVVRIYVSALDSHVYSSNPIEIGILSQLPGAIVEGAAYFISPTGTTLTPTTDVIFDLTANADVPGAVAPAKDTQGTDGSDSYNGVYDPTGNATTFSNADVLKGGAATDTLNLRVGSTKNGDTINAVSTGVEIFNITNQDSSGNRFVLNFQNTADETKVASVSSVAGSNTSAINVDSGTAAAMSNTLGTFGVNYSGTRTGTTDAFSLELNGAGSSTQTATFSTITTTGATDNTFEIANIKSSTKESFVSLGTAGMTLSTVNVSGDAKLTLSENQNFAGLKTVDASAMTGGGLFIDARGSSESSFSFTGSSSDDRIVLKNTTINTASKLDGGGGSDTLATQNFNNLNASAVNSATNFEVLEGINGAENITASNFTNINSFLFTGGASNNRSTMQGLQTGDKIILSADITYGGDEGLRLQGQNAGTAANLELRATSATNGETAITATNNGNDTAAIGLQGNVSTLNLSSTIESGTQTNANLVKATVNGFNAFGFDNQTAANINISGSQALTISAEAGVNVADGSKVFGFSNAVNVDASSFTGVLRIAGSASADTIQGGSAADIIYGLGGADVLTGNGGADQFRLAKFYNTTDVITDFQSGTDKVGLNEFNFGNTTATQAGATLNSNDYVSNVSSITTIGGGSDKKVIEIQTSQANSDMTANTGAAVEAYVLVHNSTTNKGELWYDSDWSTTGGRNKIVTFDNVTSLTGIQDFSNTDFVEYAF